MTTKFAVTIPFDEIGVSRDVEVWKAAKLMRVFGEELKVKMLEYAPIDTLVLYRNGEFQASLDLDSALEALCS